MNTGDIYYKPQFLGDGGFLSTDMARYDFVLHDSADASVFQTELLDNILWNVRYDPSVYGLYRHLFTIEAGDSSIRIGLHVHPHAGQEHPERGFVEYNPNKVKTCDQLTWVWDTLTDRCFHVRLNRWDLAQDYFQERPDFRLVKGRQKYMLMTYETTTEYLGVHNEPGFVKLYDKAKEQGFEFPLTRIELTCDGLWNASTINSNAPLIVRLPFFSENKLTGSMKCLVKSLRRNVEHDEPIQDILSDLDYRTRKKIEPYLVDTQTKLFPVQEVGKLLDRLLLPTF